MVKKVRYCTKISTGGFSTVYKGNYDNQTVAIKMFKSSNDNTLSIAKEIRCLTLTSLVSVGFIELYYEPINRTYNIIMELMDIDLFSMVKMGPMCEPDALIYLTQIVNGIEHIHSKGIAHMDIKLENCLVSGKKLKIADFNLSHVYDNFTEGDNIYLEKFNNICKPGGSESYISPEIWKEKPTFNGFLADIWSVGVCAFAILTGFFPFIRSVEEDFRYKAFKSDPISITVIFKLYKKEKEVSDMMDQWIIGCLQINPCNRKIGNLYNSRKRTMCNITNYENTQDTTTRRRIFTNLSC